MAPRCATKVETQGGQRGALRPTVAVVNIYRPSTCRLRTCWSPQADRRKDKRPQPFLKPLFEPLLQLTPSKYSLNWFGMGRNEYWEKHLWGELNCRDR